MTLLLLLGCAVFGVADQYVSSLTRFWASSWEIGALSAPWLVLPFLVGWTQRDGRRAAVVGAVGTTVALIAYGLMTVSPIEHAAFTVASFEAFVASNVPWFVGGVLTGSLFGWLGLRWRVARSRPAAFITAGAVALEPLVHVAGVRAMPLGPVPLAETTIGLAMVAWFVWQASRTPQPPPGRTP